MFKISAEIKFSAAHMLVGYEGNCERLHGHNWTVKAQITTSELDATGIAYDFRDLSAHLSEIVSRFDHQLLNKIAPFDDINPTSENLAKFIFHTLKKKLPDNVHVICVETAESEKYSAMYSEE